MEFLPHCDAALKEPGCCQTTRNDIRQYRKVSSSAGAGGWADACVPRTESPDQSYGVSIDRALRWDFQGRRKHRLIQASMYRSDAA